MVPPSRDGQLAAVWHVELKRDHVVDSLSNNPIEVGGSAAYGGPAGRRLRRLRRRLGVRAAARTGGRGEACWSVDKLVGQARMPTVSGV